MTAYSHPTWKGAPVAAGALARTPRHSPLPPPMRKSMTTCAAATISPRGADLGLLHQNNRFSLLTGAKTKAWIISSQHRQDQLYAEGNWHIGREFSVFAKFTREDHFDRYQSTWQAGLHAYF